LANIIPSAGSGPLFTVFLVFFKSEFDVVHEVIVRGALAKFIRGPVADHEAVQFVTLEVGDLQHEGPVEPVVDEFVLLFVQQSSLEGLYTFGPCKPEYVDQFVQIDPCSGSVGAGSVEFETWFSKIKNFFIVLPVLEGIAVIVPGHYLHFFQFHGVNVQSNIEASIIIDRSYRIPHGFLTEIRKIDRVVRVDGDGIIAERICRGASAGCAEDTDPVQWFCPVHIINSAMNGDLARGLEKEE